MIFFSKNRVISFMIQIIKDLIYISRNVAFFDNESFLIKKKHFENMIDELCYLLLLTMKDKKCLYKKNLM
jgi:hypothetical protein